MKTITNLAKKYELFGFFLLANLFSWVLGITLALEAQGQVEVVIPFSMHYLYAFGPTIAAFIMTWLVSGAEGLKELLGRILQWRVKWIWWVVAFSPLWLYGLIVIGQRFITGEWVDLSLLGQVNFLPQLNLGVALLLWILTFGLGEEIGWRGYALPRMQKNRSALSATLILAVLWALWHWPLFFYVLDISIVIGWLFGLIAGTFVFTWLYNSSQGSVLMIILWHGCFDFITASKAGEGSAAIIMSAIVMVWAVVVVFVYKPARLSSEEKQVL
ncbi:MAG: CPBP family intramembrane metalloprotease [Anaerolineaceae bacterium]|nr:MAG: CPBP family intramembrane metalloprotease [Anaerolineaceae bacterium]